MNEKNLLFYWCIVLVTIVLAIYLGSCVTNDRRTDESIGRRDLELIGQLESEFDEFDRRIGRIEETAGNIGTEVDRLTRLFGEYSRLVQSLRSAVTNYKSRVTEETESQQTTHSNID